MYMFEFETNYVILMPASIMMMCGSTLTESAYLMTSPLGDSCSSHVGKLSLGTFWGGGGGFKHVVDLQFT